jgi:hypothetical protein
MPFPTAQEYKQLVHDEAISKSNSEKATIIKKFLEDKMPVIEEVLASFGNETQSTYFADLNITTISQALEYVGLEVTQDMKGVENYRYKVIGQEVVRFSISGKPFAAGEYAPQTYFYKIGMYIKIVERLVREEKIQNDTDASFELRNLRKETIA